MWKLVPPDVMYMYVINLPGSPSFLTCVEKIREPGDEATVFIPSVNGLSTSRELHTCTLYTIKYIAYGKGHNNKGHDVVP